MLWPPVRVDQPLDLLLKGLEPGGFAKHVPFWSPDLVHWSRREGRAVVVSRVDVREAV